MGLMIQIAVIVALVALAALGIAFLLPRLRQGANQLPASSAAMVKDATIEAYERPSSLAAEQIESMVRTRLQQYPDLADIVLDFGAMADGRIGIWVNSRQYDQVEDIPDERIRKAIQEAVAAFNG